MFLALLAEARSNLRDYADGADVYRRLVAPSRVAHERLAAQEAILSLFVPRARELRLRRLPRQALRRAPRRRRALRARHRPHPPVVDARRARPTSSPTPSSTSAPPTSAAPWRPPPPPARDAFDTVWRQWPGQSIARLVRAIERGFGPAEYTMRDLLLEERHRVLGEVYGDLLKGVSEEYARLYDNHRHTMHLLNQAGLPIPEPLKQAAESVLGARFESEIARQRRSRDPARYRRAIKMAEDARERGLTLQRADAQRAFAEMLCDLDRRHPHAPRRRRGSARRATSSRSAGASGSRRSSPRAQEHLWEQLAAQPARTPELAALAAALGFAAPDALRVGTAAGDDSEHAIDPAATRTRPAPRAA